MSYLHDSSSWLDFIDNGGEAPPVWSRSTPSRPAKTPRLLRPRRRPYLHRARPDELHRRPARISTIQVDVTNKSKAKLHVSLFGLFVSPFLRPGLIPRRATARRRGQGRRVCAARQGQALRLASAGASIASRRGYGCKAQSGERRVYPISGRWRWRGPPNPKRTSRPRLRRAQVGRGHASMRGDDAYLSCDAL
jgi:hypothetical protein